MATICKRNGDISPRDGTAKLLNNDNQRNLERYWQTNWEKLNIIPISIFSKSEFHEIASKIASGMSLIDEKEFLKQLEKAKLNRVDSWRHQKTDNALDIHSGIKPTQSDKRPQRKGVVRTDREKRSSRSLACRKQRNICLEERVFKGIKTEI